MNKNFIEWKYLSYGKNINEAKFLRIFNSYIPERENVLDVGCGGGGIARHFEKYCGVDIEHKLLQEARRCSTQQQMNHHYICADAASLPIKSDSFLYFMSISMIEHTEDPLKVASELYRVCQKGGVFVIPCRDTFTFIYDPLNYILTRFGRKPLRYGAFGFGHHNILSRRGWRELLLKAGFEIDEVFPFDASLIGQIEFFILSLFLARKDYGDITIKTISQRTFLAARRIHNFLRLFDIETKNASSFCFIVSKSK
jgi:SAM-dependent methyltransferase